VTRWPARLSGQSLERSGGRIMRRGGEVTQDPFSGHLFAVQRPMLQPRSGRSPRGGDVRPAGPRTCQQVLRYPPPLSAIPDRQSQMFACQGVEFDRSTLANCVGGAAWWLEPLGAWLAEYVFGSQKFFAADTPIPVLDQGRGRTRTGPLWVYARDDSLWSGPDPPAAVYF
jgi:hypothetical protein